jgi:glycosyltransferase involved in cell wall biosynthesis
MVYLEAQSCNLPVVAYQDWGGGEAVVHDETGLLSLAAKPPLFTAHIQCLIEDATKRRTLALGAGEHIRRNHDLDHNYNRLENKLIALTGMRKMLA